MKNEGYMLVQSGKIISRIAPHILQLIFAIDIRRDTCFLLLFVCMFVLLFFAEIEFRISYTLCN